MDDEVTYHVIARWSTVTMDYNHTSDKTGTELEAEMLTEIHARFNEYYSLYSYNRISS